MPEIQIFEILNGSYLEIATINLPMIPTVGAVIEIPTDDRNHVLVTVVDVTVSPESGSDYAIVIQYI
jgi:hypothetical protein